MGVEPSGDVQRLQILAEHRAVHPAEILQEVLVALVGVLDVMLLRVVEEKVADGADFKCIRFRQLAAYRGHEAVIRLLDFLRRTGRRDRLAFVCEAT